MMDRHTLMGTTSAWDPGSASHTCKTWSLWRPPPFRPTQEDVKQELAVGSGLSRQACSTHSRAKNTEGSSVKVSEVRNVPRCMIMAHLRPAGPLQSLHRGFLGKVKVPPCSLDFLEASSTQSSAVEAESSENQNTPLLKVRVTLRSSRALLGDR